MNIHIASRRETEAEAGLEQLLGPEERDVEEGKEKRERSWYSLIGTALQHVWPHNFGMQARVLVCLLIVVAQRMVNLAVPILCEHTVLTPPLPHCIEIFCALHF